MLEVLEVLVILEVLEVLGGLEVPGMVGLAILANGLGWSGLASFWAHWAVLGWAGPGWRLVTKNRAARFSLCPSCCFMPDCKSNRHFQ